MGILGSLGEPQPCLSLIKFSWPLSSYNSIHKANDFCHTRWNYLCTSVELPFASFLWFLKQFFVYVLTKHKKHKLIIFLHLNHPRATLHAWKAAITHPRSAKAASAQVSEASQASTKDRELKLGVGVSRKALAPRRSPHLRRSPHPRRQPQPERKPK